MYWRPKGFHGNRNDSERLGLSSKSHNPNTRNIGACDIDVAPGNKAFFRWKYIPEPRNKAHHDEPEIAQPVSCPTSCRMMCFILHSDGHEFISRWKFCSQKTPSDRGLAQLSRQNASAVLLATFARSPREKQGDAIGVFEFSERLAAEKIGTVSIQFSLIAWGLREVRRLGLLSRPCRPRIRITDAGSRNVFSKRTCAGLRAAESAAAKLSINS